MAKRYLHQRIQEQLRQRIEEGIYAPGDKIPTTKELARELSTSSATIDKALTNLVEERLIFRKARLGSIVNPRELWLEEGEGRTGSSGAGLYGLVLRDSSSPYFWRNTINGIHDAIRARDSDIVFGYIDEDLPKAKDYIVGLYRKGVRGIVYAPISMVDRALYEEYNAEILDLFEQLEISYILIDRTIESKTASSVVSADYPAAVTLTEQLLSQGCRNPICLTHLYNSPFRDRIRGFCDTLRAHGVEDPESRVVDIAPNELRFDAKDTDFVRGTLASLGHYDGVLSVNAYNLYAVANVYARYPEIRPGPVCFVNFDDIALVNIEGLSLSAVQESRRIGYIAGELLLDEVARWPDCTFQVVKDYTFKRGPGEEAAAPETVNGATDTESTPAAT
jgi:DNA-binding LacI/PurR family transcriptional regulator